MSTASGANDQPQNRKDGRLEGAAESAEAEAAVLNTDHVRRFVVPTVSVASYEEHGNWTAVNENDHNEARNRAPDREQVKRIGQPDGQANRSSESSRDGASTTSEVNSRDGAESIASRLSQIVDEQEFLMQHVAALPTAASGNNSDNHNHNNNNNTTRQNQRPAEQLNRATKSSDFASDNQHRARTHSFASGQRQATGAKLGERRNESSGALYSSCNQFHPERGNLRALKQSLSGALERQNQRFSLDKLEAGELMLNIRRSAWKLDEFEQAFKPADEPANELPPHQADQIAGAARGEQAESLESERATGQRAFERQSLSTSSGKNLLLRVSKRLALSRKRSGSPASSAAPADGGQSVGGRRFSLSDSASGNKQQRSNQRPAVVTLQQSHRSPQQQPKQDGQQEGAPANNLLRISSGLKLNELEEKRRSSAFSMASFASSLDSTRTHLRPFASINKLLSPNRPRGHRHHKPNGGGPGDQDGGQCQCSASTLRQYLPVLEWLPAYRWREDFCADLTAGLAVAALNVSTSLAAAVVAQTELGVAFRASIFNTFVYALLCSSRHSSFGSWSIMSQMLLDSVRRALGDELILSRINLGPQASWNSEEYETWHMNIIIMYTFLIGLIQLLAGLLNLGNILASFIPEALCSSMIAATAFTMAIGQLANMCGTSNRLLWALERNTTELNWADFKSSQRVSITDLFAGLFRWIQQLTLLAQHNQQINLVACAISLTTVILLFLNQFYLQGKLRSWLKRDVFIPFEMLLLVMWIALGYLFELRDRHQVASCGAILIEFNLPNVPNLRLVRELWLDSLATALISYTMVFIMARTYANKFNYEIDGNQELIACGAGNLIGGLFDALPATASFSRTAGQVEAGGRTQMASLVNCVVLIVLAQCLGHHVAHLPVCVMSATLFFGFVRMMTRTSEALVYWRLCKVDFSIWLFTFVAILTFDLVNGFLYGFIFSLLTMLYRAQNRRCYLLGSIGQSDVYVPLPKYPLAHELEGIKIFQFCGPIHYVCADLFERLLRSKTRVNVKELLEEIEQQQQQQPAQADPTLTGANSQFGAKVNSIATFNPRDRDLPTHIILDFSMISFLDTAGIRVIKKIIVDYDRVNITIMLASLASHVAQMVKSEPTLWDTHKDRFYLTLADAVHHALRDNTLAIGNSVGDLERLQAAC